MEADTSSARTLLGGVTYFEYQQMLGRDVLIPWLEKRLGLRGLRVADCGAHHGGVLDALRESGQVREAVGLELSKEVVASSPFVPDANFRLEVGDVLTLSPGSSTFDLLLLHDVLEHVPNYREALDAVANLMDRGGHVFISFPPYYAGFGGHQHLAQGRARLVPFIHYLPSKLFFDLAQTATTEYMSADQAHDDMVAVRRTKLSLRRIERAFSEASLEIVDRDLFIVRPEFKVRYDMKVRRAGIAGRVPGLREVVVNGAFYLLRRRVRT
jgi:2-polyprenyl-3-methyl-5-hydroxy-6-metoxy-1,4-benzoquinol methylase